MLDDFATPYIEMCVEERLYSLYQRGEISKDILLAFLQTILLSRLLNRMEKSGLSKIDFILTKTGLMKKQSIMIYN